MPATSRSDVVDLQVVKHHETRPDQPDAGAILVSDDGDRKRAVWLPKAAVEMHEERGGILTITLPERLAKDKGLI